MPDKRDRIINTHDQLLAAREVGLPDVAIAPHHWESVRACPRGGWEVFRPGFNLNPKQTNPYIDDANVKVFGATARREQRPALLEEAKVWAGKRYKITDWKRNRMGAYVDARVQARFPLEKRDASKTVFSSQDRTHSSRGDHHRQRSHTKEFVPHRRSGTSQ